MRDMKFRAWDTINKKMIDTPMAICAGSWVLFTAEVEGMDCMNAIHPIQQYEIMQAIDFHDKNSKQAFEGDIVELNCLGYGGTYKTKAVVTYRNFQWWFHMIGKPEGIEWNVVASKWEPESEIIGNIYEQVTLVEV